MIPTAKDFLSNSSMLNKKLFPEKEKDFNQAVDRMIEFAKLHVQAALKAKIEAMRETYTYGGYSLDELNAFTKNAYPESNIK
jgi:hypothetical protein